jgi:uncharacterized membrane protein YkoI
MSRAVKRAAIGVFAGVWLTAWGATVQADCLPWKEAGSIVAQNSLIPGNVIYQMVQSRMGGKIIHASLCEESGKFLYKIVVLGSKGDVTNVTVDARTGQF